MFNINENNTAFRLKKRVEKQNEKKEQLAVTKQNNKLKKQQVDRNVKGKSNNIQSSGKKGKRTREEDEDSEDDEDDDDDSKNTYSQLISHIPLKFNMYCDFGNWS